MKNKILLFITTLLVSTMLFPVCLLANDDDADTIPYVYSVENTGAAFEKPILPTIDDLPEINPLPDPFMWSDSSGRDTTFASWSHRRSEIKAEIENYEIGIKPDKPEDITASYADGTLTVNVTVDGNTLTLTSSITLPEGDGPFPAVIGMSAAYGTLPTSIFSSRNIAGIPFNHDQVTTYGDAANTDPFFVLYPDQDIENTGQYAAWSWGISRLIDGLELVQDDLPIDLNHLAITGCSYAGKMALFGGAFDERIALTIAQESGGGGAAVWRVSKVIGDVETLCATSTVWFKDDMKNIFCGKENQLPEDHHELLAMCAPRACLVFGNPTYGWLADESGYVSCRAAQRIYNTFGIPNRFGFSIVGDHTHCSLPEEQYPELEAFVDRYLLDDISADTLVEVHPYEDVDYSKWMEWWGKDSVYMPGSEDAITYTLEAECATVGSDFELRSDTSASNGGYVYVPSGVESTSEEPSSSEGYIVFSFNIDSAQTYVVFARLNCADYVDDSYWVQMDDEDFSNMNGLVSSDWDWFSFGTYTLDKGEHTFSVGYREDGSKIDKISISSYLYNPEGKGEDADNLCTPEYVGLPSYEESDGYFLGQNHPNPFNENTSISFEIPENTYVSLKVYSLNGTEVTELAGKEYTKGKYTVEFSPQNIPSGIYVYTLETNNYTETKKMILEKTNNMSSMLEID